MDGHVVDDGAPVAGRASWPATWSSMLCLCGLINAKFLPAGLLTPIARDLRVLEALAGQAFTATAVTSFLAALLAASATLRLNRRQVLVGFSALVVASDLLMGLPPDIEVLLLARALLGVALGGLSLGGARCSATLVLPTQVGHVDGRGSEARPSRTWIAGGARKGDVTGRPFWPSDPSWGLRPGPSHSPLLTGGRFVDGFDGVSS